MDGLTPNWSTYALIIGGADCVWLDIARLETWLGCKWPGIVIGVNDSVCEWPRRLDYWVTLHPEKMPRWQALRRTHGHPPPGKVVGRRKGTGVDLVMQPWNGGSSGLFAVTVADLHCTHAILAGIPLTARPHFSESREHEEGKIWPAYAGHRRGWERKQRNIEGWVKSMSGWTRGIFGAPTAAWLRGNNGRR